MKKGIRLAVLALFVALAGAAAAQDNEGIYLGGSVGYTMYKDSCKGLIVPCDGEDMGWRAYAGYQFNRYFAAEFGFADLGEATGSGIMNTGTPGTFKIEWKDAFDLSGLLSFPITTRLFGFGRLGMYRARTSIEETAEGFPDIQVGGTNSGFTYGAGAEYRLGFLGVRAEWQRWENVGTSSTGEDDIDVLSLGLLIRF